jgi:hypothetical protein
MIEFRPLDAGHLRYLTPQAMQADEHVLMLSDPNSVAMINNNFGLSAWADHECIGAAGIVPIFSHRAIAWAILSAKAGDYLLPIVRKMRQVLCASPYRRIETTVSAEFRNGHCFAELLGMRRETPEPLAAHGAKGEDEYLYAMVKHGRR